MSNPLPEKSMVENEAVFRAMNQRAQNYIDELEEIADGDKGAEFLRFNDTALYFYCECADENCHDRVFIKPSVINEIHENSRRFVVLPEHQAEQVERVVKKFKKYYIVEKRFTPPSSDARLHKTDIDNTTK